eukprot:EG_transcript_54261
MARHQGRDGEYGVRRVRLVVVAPPVSRVGCTGAWMAHGQRRRRGVGRGQGCGGADDVRRRFRSRRRTAAWRSPGSPSSTSSRDSSRNRCRFRRRCVGGLAAAGVGG